MRIVKICLYGSALTPNPDKSKCLDYSKSLLFSADVRKNRAKAHLVASKLRYCFVCSRNFWILNKFHRKNYREFMFSRFENSDFGDKE